MKRKIILEAIYISFVILWGYAAFSKLFAYEIFKSQLSKSPLLHSLAPVVAIGVPVVELVLTVMLIAGKTKKAGLIGSFILMTIFTVYLIGILSFSTEIPCSCGGLLQNLTWTQHIIMNIGFIILSVIGIVLQRNWYKNRMVRNGAGKFA